MRESQNQNPQNHRTTGAQIQESIATESRSRINTGSTDQRIQHINRIKSRIKIKIKNKVKSRVKNRIKNRIKSRIKNKINLRTAPKYKDNVFCCWQWHCIGRDCRSHRDYGTNYRRRPSAASTFLLRKLAALLTDR